MAHRRRSDGRSGFKKDLLKLSKEVIVENGGDIYLASSRERTMRDLCGRFPLQS